MTDADRAQSAKDAAASVIDRHLADLVALSHAVHATPELCFNETRSAKAVADALRAGGLEVDRRRLRPAHGVRMPGPGQGNWWWPCAPSTTPCPRWVMPAGTTSSPPRPSVPGWPWPPWPIRSASQVRVLGTPAEEGGGGKIFMLERGAFEGVHAAMMVHPWPAERLTGACLAVSHFDVHFTGKEAHASAAPWEGVNALDAMTISQVALGLLRQQLPPGDQVHGVITHGGGAANVIPAACHRTLHGALAHHRRAGAAEPRVRACFEAGALATGCAVTYEELSPVYSHMEADPGLLAAYRVNAEALGRTFEADDADTPLPTFSTDMANVSLAVPTIHPLVRIETHGAVNHQHEFAAACITPSADAAVRDGAVAMAWTAIDAATDPAIRQRLLSA